MPEVLLGLCCFFQDAQSKCFFFLGVQFLSFRPLQSGQSSGIREPVGEEIGGCFQGLCGFSCESEIFGASFVGNGFFKD